MEKRLKTGSGEGKERVDPEVARLAAEARLLADLVTALRDSDDLTQTLQTIVEKLAAGLGVERCHLLLRDESSGLYRVAVEARPVELPSVVGMEVEACDPDVADVLRGGQVVVVDTAARPASIPRPISQEARNLAFVLTPLRHRGDTFGVLTVAQVSGVRRWREEELLLLKLLADHAAVAIERARLRQVTELRNQRLVELNARLVEADRLRQDLATKVLPEIRSPLSTLQMTLDMLELQMGDRDRVAKRMSRAETRRMILGAQESCARILSLLNGLIDESGAAIRNVEIVRRRCPPGEVAQRAAGAVVERAASRRVGIRTVVEPELPVLSVDVEHVVQALSIYLRNAIEASPDGGAVTLEARRVFDGGEASVMFSVVDQGAGLPPEAVPYVFDPFFGSLWAPRSDGSLGAMLDLAIVRRIAAAHGGNVGVKSRSEVGSVFSIVLPVE